MLAVRCQIAVYKRGRWAVEVGSHDATKPLKGMQLHVITIKSSQLVGYISRKRRREVAPINDALFIRDEDAERPQVTKQKHRQRHEIPQTVINN